MIRRELFIFLIVGILTVLIDFITYRSLIWLNFFSIEISKGIGFLTGTIFAYFSNKLWTFSHKNPASGSAFRFILLYFFTLAANVFVNSKMLILLPRNAHAIQIAFLIATTTSATLNFLGMKFFAFKEKFSGETI